MDETQAVSEIAGSRVKALRTARGWSVRELVEQCRAAGFEVTSNVIENIEGGTRQRRRRAIAVDELLALARVLEVSPLALLLPKEPADYQLTSSVSVPAEEAYRWIVGQREHLPEAAADVPLTVEEEEAAWRRLREHVPWLPKSAAAEAYEQLRKDYDQVRDRTVRFVSEGGTAILQANYYRNWFKSNGIEDPLEKHQAEGDWDDKSADVTRLDTKRESVGRQRVTSAPRRDPNFGQDKTNAEDEQPRVKRAARKRPKATEQGEGGDEQ